jgi:hypothetical protein
MKKGKDKMFFNSLSPSGERVATKKLIDLSLMSSSITTGLKYKL